MRFSAKHCRDLLRVHGYDPSPFSDGEVEQAFLGESQRHALKLSPDEAAKIWKRLDKSSGEAESPG